MVRTIEKLHKGQVYFHYGWCYWYLITGFRRHGRLMDCIVFRPDGSFYHTSVLRDHLCYGKAKLVFNRVRVRMPVP